MWGGSGDGGESVDAGPGRGAARHCRTWTAATSVDRSGTDCAVVMMLAEPGSQRGVGRQS